MTYMYACNMSVCTLIHQELNNQCLIKELDYGEQNKTCQITNFSKQEILSFHKSVLLSHGILYRPQIRIMIFLYYQV